MGSSKPHGICWPLEPFIFLILERLVESAGLSRTTNTVQQRQLHSEDLGERIHLKELARIPGMDLVGVFQLKVFDYSSWGKIQPSWLLFRHSPSVFIFFLIVKTEPEVPFAKFRPGSSLELYFPVLLQFACNCLQQIFSFPTDWRLTHGASGQECP